MARGPLLAIGALLLVAGGATIGYGVTRKPSGGLSPAASKAIDDAKNQLDGDIKAARQSLKERAEFVSGLQSVQAAVSADQATANDMLERGELKFNRQKGETIELGQIKDGKPVTLLVQSEAPMTSPHAGKPGSYVDLMGEQLVITEVASVTPLEGADKMGAYVMAVRPLALEPAFTKLTAAGASGFLSTGTASKQFGQPAEGATPQRVDIASVPGMHIAVAVPPKTGGMPMGIVGGGGGAAALGLVLLVLGLMSKKKSSGATSGIGTNAPTQLSTGPGGGVAAGTPYPVDPSTVSISPNNLGPGAMIGRWEIIKRLGSGGMADVYLARAKGEAGFEKTVAVKVMHPHLARNQRAVDHFLDEARLAARIAHPNVCAIQDLGKIGNDYVIVMEYVDGVDLERLLAAARAAERPVPIDVGLGILCRICDGLNAAHKAIAADGTPLNIVHRDVKSANVLVSKQGGVKVVDFGIAKAAQQGHNTVAGETKGTPSFMAPEQRVGETVDVRADVYSVAAVGYEILTGHGVNLDLAALAHLGIENWPHLPPPTSLRAQLPPELDGVLLRAMSYQRENRPADCTVLEATLEGIMKQYRLTASDKDIARWVNSELALLPPSPPDPPAQTASA